MKYKTTPEHQIWQREQIWEMKLFEGVEVEHDHIYDDLSDLEYNIIKDFMPKSLKDKDATVLEIGCGLGRASIHLNTIYPVKYILADRDGFPNVNSGDFNPPKDEYYNDFALMRSFCQMNGLTNFITFDTEKDNWRDLPKVDLIMSQYALGFHFPIKRYYAKLMNLLKEDGVMMLGIRERINLNDYPNLIKYIETRNPEPFPSQHWLILSKT